jgi:murein DD-endopeptidase MepM/ murein hydrolase activator NlpD
MEAIQIVICKGELPNDFIRETNRLTDIADREAAEKRRAQEEAAKLENGWLWPVPGVSRISSPFGPRASGDHRGIDISSRDHSTRNPNVVATRAGTVFDIRTGCNNRNSVGVGGTACNRRGICNPTNGYSPRGFCNGEGGNWITIRHGDGTSSRYMHLRSISVNRNQVVSQGQVIGVMGSTGRSEGEHLHFEILINNDHENPLNHVTPP